ncbi:muscle-specific protein 300 kDa-like [Eleginops maclovinus]|uniref:muscle-specific protein 300 kDa-like n=1 Tax=Eleginops maclovinus TaxID=56733 RepID=UPI0030802487
MTKLEVCTGPTEVKKTGVQERHPKVSTPDVKTEKAAVKTGAAVPQISTERQKNVAQRDSTQLTSVASAALKPSQAETTSADTSKKDTVKPRETGIKQEVMKTKQERPKEVKVKDDSKQEVHAQVSPKTVLDSSRTLDTKSVKIEKIEGAEVQVLQPGTQITIKEQEVTSVPTAKTSRIGIDPTSIHVEKLPENKDLTSADAQPEKTADKMTKLEVCTGPTEVKKTVVQQEHPKEYTPDVKTEKAAIKTGAAVPQISTERQKNVAQRDSTQLTSVASAALKPSQPGTTSADTSKKDTVKPRETGIKQELMKTTQERPKEVKDSDVKQTYAKVFAKDVHDSPKCRDEESLKTEKILKGAEECILKPGKQATIKEQEIPSVKLAKAPGIEIKTTTHSQGEAQNKDLSSTDVQPEQSAVKRTIAEVKTEERPKEVKGRDGQKVHAQVSSEDVLDAAKSLDGKSGRTEKIKKEPEVRNLQLGTQAPVKDQEVTSVTVASAPSLDKDQTNIQGTQSAENKDLTSADAQPEKTADKMTKLEVCTGPTEVKKTGVQEEHPKESTPDVKTEKAAVKTGAAVPQISTERQKNVAQRDSTQLTSVASAALKPSQAETTSADTSKKDTVKPRETGIKQEVMKTTQERPKEVKVKDDSKQEVHAQVSPKTVLDSSRTLDTKSVKLEKIEGAEVQVLKSGTQITIKEQEVTSVPTATTSRIVIDPTSIHVKKLPENKDLTSADVEPEKTADKTTKLEVCTGPTEVKKTGVQEEHPKVSTPDVKTEKAAVKTGAAVPQISTERQENVAPRDSTQLTSVASAALKPSQAGTTSADTSKKDTVKPRETGIKQEVMKTTQERPKEVKVKDDSKQEVHAQVSPKSVLDSSQSLDTKSVKIEKIEGAEVQVLQPGTQITVKEQEVTSVPTAKTSRIVIDPTSIHVKKGPENKDLTSAEAQPEKTADNMTKLEVCTGPTEVKKTGVQEEHPKVSTPDVKTEKAAVKTGAAVPQISTERQENVAQRDSTQLTSVASAALKPSQAGATSADTSKKDTVKPRETGIKQEVMKTTQERPKEVKVKDDSKQEVHAQVSPKTGLDSSVKIEKIQGTRVQALQPGTQITIKEQEVTSVPTVTTSRIVIDPISIHVKKEPENKELTSADVEPGKTSDKTTMIKVETKETPKAVKGRDVQEVHAEATTKVRDAPQRLEEKSVSKSSVTSIEVRKSFTDSLSEPSLVPIH